MRQRERKLTTILSGLALCLAVIAAHAASDQSRESDFEKDKKAYIKQYAVPKAPPPSRSELLFTKRTEQARPSVITDTNKNSRPTQPAADVAPPPATTEPSHE